MLLRIGHLVSWTLLLLQRVVSFSSTCEFPPHLRGGWHLPGFGAVRITTSNMTEKGECVERWENRYLVWSRARGCHQCIELMERHHNILQYRETFCMDYQADACSTLHPAIPLVTLVREGATGCRCPIQESYHFTYNNNTGGFCRQPSSYASACAGGQQLRLHFKHCSYVAYTHEQEWQLSCLGWWSDASHMFLYARVARAGLSEYRCMIYHTLGTVAYVAMSGDWTCRGLKSPRSGSLIMELSKDVYSWPQGQCIFPPWIARYTWRDLSGIRVYSVNADGSNLDVRTRRDDHYDITDTTSEFRCMKPLKRNATNNKFVAVVHATRECDYHYLCFMLIRRQDDVIELHIGSRVEFRNSPCYVHDFRHAERHLLLPSPSAPVACPYQPGRFPFVRQSGACAGHLDSGCNASSSFDIFRPCSAQPKVKLQCLSTWSPSKKIFVVASLAGKTNGRANCFSLKRRKSTLQMIVDKNCNVGVSELLESSGRFVMSPDPTTCRSPSRAPPHGRYNIEREAADREEAQRVPGRGELPAQSQVSSRASRTSSAAGVAFVLLFVFL